MPLDYNHTINLPKTDFPMRASLPAREPAMLARMQEAGLYEELMRRNADKPKFILHDGPPYANGNIHIGTALNKILKDIIVRYKNMSGFCAPYVPGWDTHGLPIESAVLKDKKVKRDEMTTAQFRDKCREFAEGFVDKQRAQFMRLGGLGDWYNPYLTYLPQFEADQIRVFGKMAERGYIYKGLKPVYWCPIHETALAEAEIEYADVPSHSVYVKFPVRDDHGRLEGLCDLAKTYFLIWTTTPWTLPGNLAISLNAGFDYILMKTPNGETYIVAKELAEAVAKANGIASYETLGEFKGDHFDLMTARHPFLARDSVILNGDHVTLEAGTGCVHTAPGFGAEDFAVCAEYDRNRGTSIGVIVPVNSKGIMTEGAGPFAGQYYAKANDAIVALLHENDTLLHSSTFTHSYPHCWRCKSPVIYRATEQWFCSVDAIKDDAIAACEEIKWYPEWGKERMVAMIAERSDWCISRQRVWGVPLPIFYCDMCGKHVITPGTVEHAARLFEEHGSNVWFDRDAAGLLPEGFACPHCGGGSFSKETDIMDVWFDSGSTHAAVLDRRPELSFPADLYLEGGDQYRGWFQSSMLTAITAKGVAPYRQIITHGWTVDGEGKAMHKSLGNAIPPEDVIKDYGADMLRLWVASADYRQDMRISKDILKQLAEAYLKIRNTARYMLGNLNGFDPDAAIEPPEMEPLDRWAVARFNDLVARARAAYDIYEFHAVYRGVYNFCVVDLSNFYLDIIKDRLYCAGKDSPARRSAMSAMYLILDGMVRLLTPMLAFTSEEIWQAMPHRARDAGGSPVYNDMPSFDPALALPPEQAAHWQTLIDLRGEVNRVLEAARAERKIGKSLEAVVTLRTAAEVDGVDLASLFIVSKVIVEKTDGATEITVAPAEAPKCSRCWNHRDEVDSATELCPRCAEVVAQGE